MFEIFSCPTFWADASMFKVRYLGPVGFYFVHVVDGLPDKGSESLLKSLCCVSFQDCVL